MNPFVTLGEVAIDNSSEYGVSGGGIGRNGDYHAAYGCQIKFSKVDSKWTTYLAAVAKDNNTYGVRLQKLKRLSEAKYRGILFSTSQECRSVK